MADEEPEGAIAARLVMSGGPLDGSEYPLPAEPSTLVIGSSVDADIQIMLGNVEAVHAGIGRSGGALFVSDVGSATGTFLNGEKVEGESPLRDGDEICLGSPGMKGSAKLVLRLSGAQADAGPELRFETPALLDTQAAPSLIGFGPEASFDEGRPAFSGTSAPVAVQDDAIFVEDAPAPAAAPARAFVPPPPAVAAPAISVPPAAASIPPPPPPARATVPPPPPPRRGDTPNAGTPAPAVAPPPPPRSRTEAMPTAAEGVRHGSEPRLAEEAQDTGFPALRPEPRGKKRAAAKRRSLFTGLSAAFSPKLLGALAGVVALAGVGYYGRGLLRSDPPQIASVSPQEIVPGQTVTITGVHFAKDPSANTVFFGKASGTVSVASATELKVTVPPGTGSRVAVVVQTASGRSNAVNVTATVAGEVTGIEPEVAWTGQRVLIRGAGLASGSVSVQIGGTDPTSIERGPDGVRVVVPNLSLPEGSRTTMTVQAGSKSQSFELLIGHLPLLLEAEPKSGRAGQKIVLTGRGFDPEPRANTVTLGRQPALVLAADPRQLQVFVPGAVATDVPELPVAVTVAGRTSKAAVTFVLTRSSGTQFRPSFFPDAVPELPGQDVAFVSTVLGPVFLLGGPAGAASAAARAEGVANALNALVDASTGEAPAIELREGSGVAVAGSPRPLLSVTEADVAAYSRAWDGGRPRKLSAAAVARHWTALLQDYLGLFLARQRPVQMLALSSRGRVLSDIFAEAARRAPGERAVPSSIVENAAGSLAQPLRQVALVVSTEAPRAAAAVEGRWQGSFDDPDAGARRFSAHIQSQGGAALGGTLTTWAGSIEVRSPLRDVVFEKGVLRFTARLQGSDYRFRGTVESSRLTGSIEREGKPPLSFTMDYLD